MPSYELAASNPAHPTVITIKSGVMLDGRIVARQVRAAHASGGYGAVKSNTSLATWHYAGGQYRIDHSDIEFMQIYTNTVPGGYYRSPGAVTTAFAVDSHTDIIAKELGMDSAEFRLKNFLGEGEVDAVGDELKDVHFREVLQSAQKRRLAKLFGRPDIAESGVAFVRELALRSGAAGVIRASMRRYEKRARAALCGLPVAARFREVLSALLEFSLFRNS